MDTPIDKLVFALGGDVSALNDAFKQAEASAAKTGTTIQQNLGKGFKDAASQAQSDASAIKSTFSGIEEHVGKISSHIQVSRREMIYAFREVANGDIQRLPATMALLLSHMLEISPAAIAMGAAIGAIPLAVTVAAVKADQALAKLRTSMALTANASGVSLSQATSMSAAAAGASGGSISDLGAQRIMGGLIGAGVPRSLLGQGTLAAGNYALGAGVSQEDATALVSRMLMDPAKSAQELNKSMHLLTVSQTEMVKDLADSGQQEKAAAIVLAEFTARSKEAAEQAGIWSKTINTVGNWLGNLGHGIALAAGGGSAQERLDVLNEQDKAYFLSQGTAGMARFQSGAHMPGYAARLQPLQDQLGRESADAKTKGAAATSDMAIGGGLADAYKQSDAAAQKLREFNNELGRDTWAVNQAKDAHSSYLPVLERQREAVEKARDAFKQFGQPGMAEGRQLRNARQLAGTPIEQQGIVRARQEAQEAHIRELMNPETSLQADANYKTRQQTANLNLNDVNRAAEQQRRLQSMQEEAAGAARVASAYDVSRGAMERARIEAEVDVMVTNKQIAAKDRQAAVQAKLATAIDQTRQAVGKQIESAELENEATRIELAAGGDPLARMRAAAAASAYKTTQPAMELAAGDPGRQAIISRQRLVLTNKDYERSQMDAQKSAQGTLFGAQANLAGQQRLYAAQTSGMSDDDLRRFQVWNQLVQEFTRQGLDPADVANQKLFKDTLQANTALSDLGDEMQKTSQEAKGLADAITGGLANWIRNPNMNWKDALAGIGQNMLSTVVQTNILDPLNKFLTSQFSDVIGGGALGSSPLNPMYVTSAGGIGGFGGGGGGLFGSGSGSSGGGGFFDSILGMFGMGGTGAAGSAGISEGFADSMVAGDAAASVGDLSGLAELLPLLALAGGGPTQAGRSYLVGEDGPELWTEGASGYMTPAPMVQSALSGRSRGQGGGGNGGDTNMHFHLPNVTDTKSFIQSRSQIENAYYKMAARGKRNA